MTMTFLVLIIGILCIIAVVAGIVFSIIHFMNRKKQ